MGWLTAIALGAAYESEQARLRSPKDPDPPSMGDCVRAAKSCYPGVFAPRQLARGEAEAKAIRTEEEVERAALESHRNRKHGKPRSR